MLRNLIEALLKLLLLGELLWGHGRRSGGVYPGRLEELETAGMTVSLCLVKTYTERVL